eukprot:15093235-Alexandrium_andersonii.AAC.1
MTDLPSCFCVLQPTPQTPRLFYSLPRLVLSISSTCTSHARTTKGKRKRDATAAASSAGAGEGGGHSTGEPPQSGGRMNKSQLLAKLKALEGDEEADPEEE